MSTQLHIHWVTAFFFRVKWAGREANRSPPSSADVNECSSAPTRSVCVRGVDTDIFHHFSYYYVKYL
jgi:hypothetical protein